MRINVHIDSSALKVRMGRESKRLAYNTALALNETGDAIQAAERVNLDRKFTIRRAGFMYRLIKRTFASARQNRPYVEVYIDPTKERVLLGRLETGGVKLPGIGKSVAVPLTGGPARPSFGSQVTQELQIGKLRFKQRRTKSGKIQWVGRNRTFITDKGIFQRGGGHKTSRRRGRFKGLRSFTTIKLIYAFKKAPKLRAMLGFMDTALRVFNDAREGFREQFRKAYIKP